MHYWARLTAAEQNLSLTITVKLTTRFKWKGIQQWR